MGFPGIAQFQTHTRSDIGVKVVLPGHLKIQTHDGTDVGRRRSSVSIQYTQLRGKPPAHCMWGNYHPHAPVITEFFLLQRNRKIKLFKIPLAIVGAGDLMSVNIVV